MEGSSDRVAQKRCTIPCMAPLAQRISTMLRTKIECNPGMEQSLVREEYAEDTENPVAISVMYRAKGADAKNSDWYWLSFLPDGSVAKSPADAGGRPIAGRVASCIECHQKAGGKDLVFLNDAMADGK